jgi:hypothetical protein
MIGTIKWTIEEYHRASQLQLFRPEERTICYTLTKVDNGTILKVEHNNFKSEEMYSDMLNVWDFLLSNLKDFVENN